jgi:hypothetical protein
MAFGLLDSIYDAIHVFSENKLSSNPTLNTTAEVMESELPSKENAKETNGSNVPGPSNLSLSLSLSLTCTNTRPLVCLSYLHSHIL